MSIRYIFSFFFIQKKSFIIIIIIIQRCQCVQMCALCREFYSIFGVPFKSVLDLLRIPSKLGKISFIEEK